MKTCLFALMFLMVLASCGSCGIADELPSPQQLRQWIKDLSSCQEPKREDAAHGIYLTVWDFIEANRKDKQRKAKALPSHFLKTLQEARPDIIDAMQRSSMETGSAVKPTSMMCLAIMKDDGSVLRKAVSENLQGDTKDEFYSLQFLLMTTPYTLPNEQSVIAALIRDIQRLSPAARQLLESDFTAKGADVTLHGAIHFSISSMSLTLVETDRTLKEIPHLIELLDKKFPEIVRIAVADLLGQFGEESGDSLPMLEKMLKEKSSSIRLSSARAIVAIRYDSTIAQQLSVNLDKQDRKEFLDWAKKADYSVLSDSTEADILTSLDDPSPFMQRQGLRRLSRIKTKLSQEGVARVQEFLSAPAPETRELAKQVLKQLQNK